MKLFNLFYKPLFTLKRNDKVFIFYKDGLFVSVKVDFFQLNHMRYIDRNTGEAGFIVYNPYRFYASGYEEIPFVAKYRYITVKKKWHYHFALIAEWLRLNFISI